MASSSSETDSVAPAESQTGESTRVQLPSDSLMPSTPSSSAVVGDATPMPERIGRYVIESRIGAGGMGIVYSAHDPKLDRTVAIKMLNPSKTSGSSGSEGAARLLREAQAMAQLSHPNVIQIFDFGRAGDGVFIAMEFVEGATLSEWMVDEDRTTPQILALFVRAGRGLVAAHAAGLVHRDFKPDNVLVGDDGRVHVADFGLARPTSLESSSLVGGHTGAPRSLGTSSDSLTAVGAVMGTPTYMSPEQHRGETADARSDQYSYCVALFKALYGASPFQSRTLEDLAVLKHAAEITWPPEPPRAIPPHVVTVLRRGLQPRPDDRWPSMSDLLSALDRPEGRRSRWVALTVVGGAGALALLMSLRPTAALEDQVCDRDARVWSSEQRASVVEAFARGDAQELSERTLATLDRYDEDWSRRHAEACDHERVEIVHACLADLERQFAAIVQRLSEFDATELPKATRLVSRLAPIQQCTPEASQLTRPQPPVEIAEAVDALRAELDTAASYEASGAPQQGLTLMDSVVERARALDYAPLLAEALYRQGRLRRHMSDGEGALRCFTEAVHIAEARRYDTIVANAAIEAMTTLGLTLHRNDEALEWARRAEAAVERIGRGQLEEARLHHHEGIIRARAGQFEHARALMTQSIEMRRQLQGPDHADVAANLLDLGAVLGDMGNHEEAYETGLEALATWERAVGPDHQYGAFARMNVGLELMALQRFDEAQPYLEKAHEVLTDILGADHPATLSALNNLGQLHQRTDRLDLALPIAEEVLQKRIERFGTEHRDVARAHGNVALVYVKLEQYEQALPHAKTALRVMGTLYEPTNVELMTPSKMLADILELQGKAAEALPLREQALTIAREAYGDDDIQVGRMLASRAATRLELGQPAEAAEDAQAALERFAGEDQQAQREGEAGFVLAKALAASGERVKARETAKTARTRLLAAKSNDEVTRVLGEVDEWLEEHGEG